MVKEKGRNGNTKTIIGAMMRFPLNDNIIPIMTTNDLKLVLKNCFGLLKDTILEI